MIARRRYSITLEKPTMLKRYTGWRCAVGATLLLAAAGLVQSNAVAQYPTKPILIVAPFSVGGDSDLAARNVAAVVPKHLGQNAIVLNKVGASGAIGSEYVKRASGDGYTLLLARVGSQAVLPAMKPDLSYKWNDFTFLGLLELNPYVCSVRADSAVKTFTDLVDAIRKSPGKLRYSTAGIGTIHEMGPQLLFDLTKMGKDAAAQVPYKGGGDAGVALLQGEVDFMCSNLANVIAFVGTNRVRPLMVTTPQRYREIPNVPTAREVGYAQMERIVGWSALYGPPKMEPGVVRVWTDTLVKIAKDPQWIAATEKIGAVPRILPPADSAKFIQEQFETYFKLGKDLGIVLK
jgi:tripartite-type tricarboxylate transporter receptor subunit TctC